MMSEEKWKAMENQWIIEAETWLNHGPDAKYVHCVGDGATKEKCPRCAAEAGYLAARRQAQEEIVKLQARVKALEEGMKNTYLLLDAKWVGERSKAEAAIIKELYALIKK